MDGVGRNQAGVRPVDPGEVRVGGGGEVGGAERQGQASPGGVS